MEQANLSPTHITQRISKLPKAHGREITSPAQGGYRGARNSELSLTIPLPAAEEKQNGFCRYIVTNKVTLRAASYSACVVYTKTIIHLSVGESGGYLPSHFGE